MLTLILILIFIISVASTWWFGLWSNLITLVNILLSALVATSFYQNLSFQLNVQMPTYSVLLPFISAWLLFALTFIVLRSLTDFLSGLRVKFDKITEMAGRSILSLAVAWILVSFVSFTLQMAPLPPELFERSKENLSDTRELSGNASDQESLGPDRAWVSFVRSRSEGSLSYTAEETDFFPAYDPKLPNNSEPIVFTSRTFDPHNSFWSESSKRRKDISKMDGLRTPTAE